MFACTIVRCRPGSFRSQVQRRLESLVFVPIHGCRSMSRVHARRISYAAIFGLSFSVLGCGKGEPKVHGSNGDGAAFREVVSPVMLGEFGRAELLSDEAYEALAAQDAVLQDRGIPGFHPIYVAGRYKRFYVQPSTGKIAWQGLTCTNPDCSGTGHDGGPFVFPDVIADLRVNRQGDVTEGLDNLESPRCRVCGRSDTLERYSPPDVVRRRAKLQIELAEVRRKRGAARQNGEPLPTDLRSPTVIMEQISNLPALYFVPD